MTEVRERLGSDYTRTIVTLKRRNEENVRNYLNNLGISNKKQKLNLKGFTNSLRFTIVIQK